MDIREYLQSDREACLAVFDSNMPGFFDANEREGYRAFLENPDCSYFVLPHEGAIASCGGFSVTGEVATLVWGMVRNDLHKMGLGRFLLMFRLRQIGRTGIPLVRLDTSQHAAPFYLRQGFRILDTIKDGYAPGLDRVQMVKRLTVCA